MKYFSHPLIVKLRQWPSLLSTRGFLSPSLMLRILPSVKSVNNVTSALITKRWLARMNVKLLNARIMTQNYSKLAILTQHYYAK